MCSWHQEAIKQVQQLSGQRTINQCFRCTVWRNKRVQLPYLVWMALIFWMVNLEPLSRKMSAFSSTLWTSSQFMSCNQLLLAKVTCMTQMVSKMCFLQCNSTNTHLDFQTFHVFHFWLCNYVVNYHGVSVEILRGKGRSSTAHMLHPGGR